MTKQTDFDAHQALTTRAHTVLPEHRQAASGRTQTAVYWSADYASALHRVRWRATALDRLCWLASAVLIAGATWIVWG